MLITGLCQGECGFILLADANFENNDLLCPKCGGDFCFGTCCVPGNEEIFFSLLDYNSQRKYRYEQRIWQRKKPFLNEGK